MARGKFSEAIGSLVELASTVLDAGTAETSSIIDEAEALLPEFDDENEVIWRWAEIATVWAWVHSQVGKFALAMRQYRDAEALLVSLADKGWRVFVVLKAATMLLRSRRRRGCGGRGAPGGVPAA